MVRVALVLFLSFFFHAVYAQKKNDNNDAFLFNSALDFIQFEDYESAHTLLLQLDSLKPNNETYTFFIGVCLFRSLDKIKSLYYFLKARQLGYAANPINYYLALSYRYNYDLDNAAYYLRRYLTNLSPEDKDYETNKHEALELIDQVTSSREILNHKLSVGVRNLGRAINSEAADYVPILLSKDSVIVFTSRRKGSTGGKISKDGSHYEDIYTAKKDKTGEWQRAEHFPGFNGKHHDANVAINKAENDLYIFKVNGHGNIYVSKKGVHNRWLRPRPVREINSRYWEGSLCLSPKEDTIFFSSDRPGGYGGSDIYVAVKNKNGRWSNIKNLGPSINTPADEDAPYMHNDGKTFFFSSKGHNSIGGYDVFSARRIGNGWGEIKNVGFPINTVDDDIYFQLNSEASFGYFTSFRHNNFHENSIGEKDVFEITRPNSSPVFFVFKGLIYDERSKEAVPAIVSLKDMTDTTKAEQKLITDLNTGKFRYDLKFENHYKLTVEIGDKTYFSKELYFPYQPDLFETFLDIPLRDIPTFSLKLHDIIGEEKDSSSNVMLDESKISTLVLVRKIQYNDSDLSSLLKKKIPMSFRKRLMDQLKKADFVDDNTDEQLQEVMSNAKAMDSIYSDGNEILKKLAVENKDNVERINLLTSLKKNSMRDSVLLRDISDQERRTVKRIADYVTENGNVEEKTVDLLFVDNLKAEEVDRVIRLVAQQLKTTVDFAKDTMAMSRFNAVVAERRKQAVVRRPLNEAWGILYTIEASHYKYLEQEQLTFKGVVTHRSNNKRATELKLLLVDDRGAIYKQALTNSQGEIVFSGLAPGGRYHILVDDYVIALLGRSRYEMTIPSVQSHQEDYLKFYYGLSPEQRRTIDRIIADSLLNEDYTRNSIHRWQDESEYEKLPEEEKKLIDDVAAYLSSSTQSDSNFFMPETTKYQYEHASVGNREIINRLVARRLKGLRQDSIFFQKLSDHEKKFISQLKENRRAKKIIVEDILLSKEDSDFWYVVDEISTKINGDPKAVSIFGRLTNQSKAANNFQIALLDEYNQLIHLDFTDSLGNFEMLSVAPGKKYKVVISNGTNIARVTDYRLGGVKIEADEENFYEHLSPEEKRMVDRIMATVTANEYFQMDSTLLKRDVIAYDSLPSQLKEFINRLHSHLFATQVTQENTCLKNIDNHYYYSLLNAEQRNFINRQIVLTHHNLLNNAPILLSERDRVFYEKLTQNQKQFIDNLRRRRKALGDAFAENPVLMADRFWVLLDSVKKPNNWTNAPLSFSGQLVDKLSRRPVPNIAIMVANEENKFMGQVTTDSCGQFRFTNLSVELSYNILAENRRVFFSEKFNYEIRDLHIVVEQTDSIFINNAETSHLTVYFDFDSDALTKNEREKLSNWLIPKIGPGQKIMLEGHADPVGRSDYNQVLSEKRAAAVKRFFAKSGYSPEQITTIGLGETKLRYGYKNAGLNRRVEIQMMNHQQ